MSDIRSIHLRRLQGKLGNLAYEATKVQISRFSQSPVWHPSLNVYRCEGAIAVCVDLAGVDKSFIELHVEPRRLLIRGRRETPRPNQRAGKAIQVLEMEIDSGPFEREVLFPFDVETRTVTANQENGLLWICLLLRAAT